MSERSTQPINPAVAGSGATTAQITMVLLHGLLKTWGEFLRRALDLAKRRRLRGYDAVKLSAAHSNPCSVSTEPAGDAWQIRHIKSKSDTMKPGLDYKSRSGFIHVILIENQFTERSWKNGTKDFLCFRVKNELPSSSDRSRTPVISGVESLLCVLLIVRTELH